MAVLGTCNSFRSLYPHKFLSLFWCASSHHPRTTWYALGSYIFVCEYVKPKPSSYNSTIRFCRCEKLCGKVRRWHRLPYRLHRLQPFVPKSNLFYKSKERRLSSWSARIVVAIFTLCILTGLYFLVLHVEHRIWLSNKISISNCIITLPLPPPPYKTKSSKIKLVSLLPIVDLPPTHSKSISSLPSPIRINAVTAPPTEADCTSAVIVP